MVGSPEGPAGRSKEAVRLRPDCGRESALAGVEVPLRGPSKTCAERRGQSGQSDAE